MRRPTTSRAAGPDLPGTLAASTDSGGPGARAVLTLACVGVFVIILDATVVSVALPDVTAALRLHGAARAWVVNAYTLAFAGALLVGGRLVANHGTRPAFLAGVAGFGLASLACGLAPDAAVLLTARAAQGTAGALIMPTTLTMVSTAHADARRRGRALGVWSAVGATGAASGTVAGGVLTGLAGWRWIFLVNVPVALAAVAVAARVLAPAARGPHRARLDLPGAALATGGLTALVLGVLDSAGHGWTSTPVLAATAGGTALLALFLVHQRRWADEPLVPPRLFGERHVGVANTAIFCLGSGFFAAPVLLSLYLQGALGYSPLRAGLAFLPAAAALFTGAQLAGRLAHRLGVRAVAVSGALCAAAGFGLLARVGAHTSYAAGLAGPQVLFGLGVGVAFTPITMAATAVPDELAGVAAGVLNTVRQVAAALGLAVLSAMASGTPRHLAHGTGRAFLVAAAAALTAAAVAALLPRRPRAS